MKNKKVKQNNCWCSVIKPLLLLSIPIMMLWLASFIIHILLNDDGRTQWYEFAGILSTIFICGFISIFAIAYAFED